MDRVEQLANRNNKVAKLLTNLSYLIGFVVFLCVALTQVGWYHYLVVPVLLIAGAVMVRCLIRNVFHTFRKREDYRAIAEGTRVQAFWPAAGIRQSVADNYLQRLRGDLAWIRTAINSLILPCDATVAEFYSSTGHRSKLKRFQEVLDHWVKNQEHYFSKGTYRKNRTKEILSFLGFIFLAACGLLTLLFVLVKFNILDLRSNVVFLIKNYGVSHQTEWGLLALGVIAFFLLSNFRFSSSFSEQKKKRNLNYDLKVFAIFKHSAFRLAIGLILGFLTYSWAYNYSSPNFAAQTHLKTHDLVASFAQATLLALGGLWVAYSNTIFAKEDAKRYADMRGQFGAARRKIAYILGDYELMINQNAHEAELSKMQKGIQELFLTLGREAIHEQTEWLMMRRSRPVDPVASVR